MTSITCPCCGATIHLDVAAAAGIVSCHDKPSSQTTGIDSHDILALAEACTKKLKLTEVRLAPEYFYQSLSLCVLDSVFSIGVRYGQVRKVVDKYCSHFGLATFRPYGSTYPPTQAQHSISQFLVNVQKFDADTLAREVFHNRTRTSSESGILKADAVVQFARVMKDFGVEYFQDIPNVADNESFGARIRAIPGQKSGLTTSYLFMLAGNATLSKPDRHVIAFWEQLLGRRPSPHEVQAIMEGVVKQLRTIYPELTVRTLDYAVWSHQRKHDTWRDEGRS